MDHYFPWILLATGAYLKIVMLVPELREKFAAVHPLPNSIRRVNRAAVLFLIVGALWGLQDLILA
jgi:hypothetical protein